MLNLVPTMRAVLNAVLDKLDPAPDRAYLLNSGDDFAVYDCCDDGAVWVRLAGIRPAGTAASGAVLACPAGFVATRGVGVVRCVQAMQEDGASPESATLTAEAEQAFADMLAVEQAIRCTLPKRTPTVGTLRWAPMTPEGGCGGGEWTVETLIEPCC